MKVDIIGSGPAGILAAFGALQEGCEVTVWSPPGVGRSVIHGAQYIHGEIQGLHPSLEPFEIRYKYIGDEETYRQKIYGDAVLKYGTSWGSYGPKEWAWSMRDVYHYLYSIVESNATMNAKEIDLESILRLVEESDYVFNTAPLNKIVPDGEYRYETVFIVPRGIWGVSEDEIIYLGNDEYAYRTSNIQGHASTEYPVLTKVPFLWRRGGMAARVIKPLDCVVELPGVCRLGRYGKWQKGVLVHDSYEEARNIIQKRLSWTASLPV